MTEFVGSNLNFGDLILKEEFDYRGKVWRSFLLVPQEHLEDLFRCRTTIKPIEAYNKAPEFWDRISELTCDFYRRFLDTQADGTNGGLRSQWFQWKDFGRLETAYRAFVGRNNQPIRLSIVAREPVH